MSTGPHLHYEVIFNGKKVNSQKLKLPSGRTLKGIDREKFEIVKIKTNVLNTKDEVVSAYIITQIKDSNNVIQHLSWSTINIIPGKTSNINSELIMESDGVHTFEIFVFDNLSNFNPISEPLKIVL